MAQGAAPLLCFVDDDDYVEPGSYDACIAALRDSSLCGAYTRFRTIDASTSSPLKISAATPWSRAAQASYVFEVMHLHVFRRAAAEPHFREIAQWDTGEEALLMGLMTKSGGWLKIDRVGYTKRNHGAGAGSRISGKMVKQLQYRLRPILLPTHRPSILRPTGCRRCDGARQIGSAALKKLGR
jgi:hypothetical protein